MRNKKAVSAIIGVILMVAITVAIAATVYVYVSYMVNREISVDMYIEDYSAYLEKMSMSVSFDYDNPFSDKLGEAELWIMVDNQKYYENENGTYWEWEEDHFDNRTLMLPEHNWTLEFTNITNLSYGKHRVRLEICLYDKDGKSHLMDKEEITLIYTKEEFLRQWEEIASGGSGEG